MGKILVFTEQRGAPQAGHRIFTGNRSEINLETKSLKLGAFPVPSSAR